LKIDKIIAMKALSAYMFSFLLFATIVNAQGVPTSIQSINLKPSNENPIPGQQLTVTAESYSFNLNSSNITWTLNGSLYQKGVGVTSIQVKAPDLGKKLAVGISASTPDGKGSTASINIGSGNIDIIVENNGYVPTFFSGKIPLSYQNTYRIIAVPHLANSSGVEYDPKTLIYKWTKDTQVIEDQDGYGKQVFSWQDEMVPRQRTISVSATTRDGSVQAEKSVSIQAQNPFALFYNNDSLYGPMYNKAVGEKITIGKNRELAILAVPYGFNESSKGDNLSFSWLLNSIEQTALSASQSIVLRAPQDASGSSDIQLQIKNDNQILQGAQNGFTAAFLANSSTTNSINNYNGI
jgi:hypothetical protein